MNRMKFLVINVVLLGIIMGCVGIMTRCVTPAEVKRYVERGAKTLPQPEATELLAEALRNRSGSDCLGAAYYWLYGSNVPSEEIVASYRISLLDAGWEEVEIDKLNIAPQFRERLLARFRKEGYLLTVERTDIDRAVLFMELRDDKTMLEAKAKEFREVLLIKLSYTTCDVCF